MNKGYKFILLQFISISVSLFMASLISASLNKLYAQRSKTQHVLTGDEAKIVKKDAASMFATDNYKGALTSYLDLYKSDPKNSEYNYRLGYCYLVTSVNKQAAEKYFEFANQSKDAKKEGLYFLGMAYMYNQKWDEAEKSFNEYKDATHSKPIKDFLPTERMIEMCRNGKDLSAKPVNCSFTNLGKTINSIYEEFNPYISADGDYLVYTARKKGNVGGFIEDLGIYTADIYSTMWKDTIWTKAKSMGANVNSEWDEIAVGITAAGDQVFVYYDNAQAFEDVALASLKGKMWQRPVLLTPEVNSKEFEGGACTSLDGSVIYFSSERKDVIGRKDIWMIKKEQNGKWGNPENLGKTINTAYDEDSPFLSADGKSLYFSSKGWNSMGGYDIFCSRWNEREGKWDQPVNLGFPINDADDNQYISLTGDNRFAYLSSVRPEGLGDKDIYRVEFLDTLNHPFTHLITGTVTGVGGRIELTKVKLENKRSSEITEYRPGTAMSNFVLTAQPGEYVLHIEGYNFAPYTEDLTVSNEFPPVEIKKTIQVKSAK